MYFVAVSCVFKNIVFAHMRNEYCTKTLQQNNLNDVLAITLFMLCTSVHCNRDMRMDLHLVPVFLCL